MVIDTSALVAIILSEPPAERLILALDADPVRLISAATAVEVSLVLLGRYGAEGEAQFDRLMRSIGAEIVAVDAEQAEIARSAGRRFGRGRHSAALDCGDCFSYALAMSRSEPLLFVGNDFMHTDVEACRWNE